MSKVKNKKYTIHEVINLSSGTPKKICKEALPKSYSLQHHLPSPSKLMSSTKTHTFSICDHSIWYWRNHPNKKKSNTKEQQRIPKQCIFSEFFSKKIKNIACGSSHCLFITIEGELFSMGDNSFGELGLGDYLPRVRPTPVSTLLTTLSDSATIITASGGMHHSLVLTSTGHIYSFGSNEYGQLGIGPMSSNVHTPTLIKSLQHYKIIIIAASHYGHGSYCSTNYGFGWRWGSFSSSCSCEDSQYWPIPLPFPIGSCLENNNEHVIIDFDLKSHTEYIPSTYSSSNSYAPSSKNFIIGISAGVSHVLFLTVAGEVWSMGLPNSCLGLGLGNSLSWVHNAASVLLPGNVLINGVCCGDYHSYLTTTTGDVLYCGGDTHIFQPILTSEHKCWSITVSEYSSGLDFFNHEELTDIQDEEEEEEDNDNMSIACDEDNEDYWGEEGLGYELEMDFNMETCASAPFGKTFSSFNTVTAASWKLADTKRIIQNTVYGALFPYQNREVFTPTPRNISDTSAYSSQKVLKKTNSIQIIDRRDSFQGLVGKARRKVVLTAGIDGYCCVHIVNYYTETDMELSSSNV